MGRRYETVSLLTDYGLDDEFVGVVKSVIRDLAPHVTTIDLTHGIRPFDVRAGSLALARAIPYVPDGVVVAVVDPGVGTSRKAIAVEVADGAGVLVGPDNGLLAPAVALAGGATRAVELDNAAYHLEAPGATFAGRDVFAPAAAHLCNGVDLDELGSPLDAALLVPGMIALPRTEADGIHAEVLWVDRFGNCQLNVGPDELAALTTAAATATATSSPSSVATSGAALGWSPRSASWRRAPSASCSTARACTPWPSTAALPPPSWPSDQETPSSLGPPATTTTACRRHPSI